MSICRRRQFLPARSLMFQTNLHERILRYEDRRTKIGLKHFCLGIFLEEPLPYRMVKPFRNSPGIVPETLPETVPESLSRLFLERYRQHIVRYQGELPPAFRRYPLEAVWKPNRTVPRCHRQGA